MDIRIERTFDAPLEKVWKAWTDPEQVQRWWGPRHFTAPVIKIDFREGGKFIGMMKGQMPDGSTMESWSAGTYQEIVPMRKIVSTDYFSDSEGNWVDPKTFGMPGEWPKEMRVTVTFEEVEGKTKLTLFHEGHPDAIAKDAEQGWGESLDKLAETL